MSPSQEDSLSHMPPAGMRLRWHNFRAFRDTGWLELRPITVLIGPNNSGKSSLIAPLLLLKQTIRSRDLDAPLVTRGELINAGSYGDMVLDHDLSKNLRFDLALHVHDNTGMNEIPPVGTRSPGGVNLEFGKEGESNGPVLASYTPFDIIMRPYFTRVRNGAGLYKLRRERGGLDLPIARRKDSPPVARAARRAIARSTPDHFLFSSRSVIREALLAAAKEVGEEFEFTGELEVDEASTLYLRIVDTVRELALFVLDHTHYIGPLRERPLRSYELSGETPEDVGSRGQWAPELIFRDPKGTICRETRKWLRKFGVADELHARRLAEDVFSLSVTREGDGVEINIADTGFGLTQVLPLVVQGAYSDTNSLIIAEQPEIHLNPRLQAVLAELFVHIASSGRSVLIETHSEHLLLRLRRLVAEGSVAAEDISLYFVEPTGHESQVKRVPIDANGHIRPEDWPVGFFGEPLADALALAMAQSPRARAI